MGEGERGEKVFRHTHTRWLTANANPPLNPALYGFLFWFFFPNVKRRGRAARRSEVLSDPRAETTTQHAIAENESIGEGGRLPRT